MARRLLFDVSGLVQWYAFLRHPSGIQRVTENILGSILQRAAERAECIARPPGSTTFYCVESSIISGLLNPEARDLSIARLRRLFGDMIGATPPSRLLPAIRWIHIPYVALGYSKTGAVWEALNTRHALRFETAAREIVPPSSEDVLVGLGDFWCHQGHVKALTDLKQQSHSRLVHMIHDLFGVTRPEWTHPNYGRPFVEQLARLAPHVDRWLVNSQFVAGSLRHYLQSVFARDPAVDVVPMGWNTFPIAPTGSDARDSEALARFNLADRPYVLHVGSVEPRKNLLTLVEAFCRLRHEQHPAPPLCVLVGQNGWKAREIVQRIRDANRDGEIIRWIRDTSDNELAALYRGATFTVVPSRIEGWGLAVQESLAQGTPCIASRSGGLIEAGLDLACYIDPDSPDELYEALAHWIATPEALSSERRRLKCRMGDGEHRATWSTAADAVLAACDEIERDDR